MSRNPHNDHNSSTSAEDLDKESTLSCLSTITLLDVELDFDDIGLSEPILKGIYEHGFEKPNSVQRQIIGSLIRGRDLSICQRHSGGGKTSAIAIGVLDKIDYGKLCIQALFLVPSRELAQATAAVIRNIGAFRTDLVCYAVIGGIRVRQDIAVLNQGAHVVVATPGRTMDLLQRGVLNLDSLRMVVLDELDEIIDRGFGEQLEGIFERIETNPQVVVSSCVVPPQKKFLDAITKDPLIVT